jgi:hypothetical protein
VGSSPVIGVLMRKKAEAQRQREEVCGDGGRHLSYRSTCQGMPRLVGTRREAHSEILEALMIPLISDFWPRELGKNKYLLFLRPQFVVLLFGSTRK